jgi:diguanylate cyclase (GGDEF)-like protein
MNYPINDREPARLEALRALKVVGSPPSAPFDGVVRLICGALDCPIAFISLLDDTRQWFKAKCGLGDDSTPRRDAFCNYTILGSGPFIIEDTKEDERFAHNPQVTGKASIRFYAGVPITAQSGYRLGAVCACDTRPRKLSAQQIAWLAECGRIVEGLFAAYEQSVYAQAAVDELAGKAQVLWKKKKLLEQTERFGKIGGWELDVATFEIACSDEISRIHDLASGPHSLKEALEFYPEPWRAVVERNVETAMSTGRPYNFEAEFVSARGTRKWVRAVGECEMQNGRPVRLFGTFQDITLEKDASQRLWQAANFDELTGLANRRHFKEALDDALALATNTGTGVSLYLLDLDNFKEINDTRGHAVGDEILAQIGRRLSQTAAEGDIVARLGGDEFAVLSTGEQPDGADRKAVRILSCLRTPIHIGSMHIYISGTLGCARAPGDACSAPELLKKADLALYSAKDVERGSVMYYASGLDMLFERHSRAIELARSALARGRLTAYYQPKICLDSGVRIGFEALARIEGEDGTILTPGNFAAALEDRVIARRIGKHMLQAVTADLAAWRDRGLEPVSVSINVGEADFADGRLTQRILNRLDELALPHSCLTVEVMESVFLGGQSNAVRETLNELDRNGVKIELDDFGTGYASLTHLRTFPVSRLKIDKTFIDPLGRDADTRLIVQSVIDLGHNLGCEIVAEGIETLVQLELLAAMGCDTGQGFLLGSPASAEDTRLLLEEEALQRQQELSAIAAAHAAGRSRAEAGRMQRG